AGNIGGGGFMMIRGANGDTEIIDYRERAPLSASRDMYLDKDGNVIKGASTVGYKAVGVPGTVAGLALALKRHGKMRWADLVEPSRKLAAEGFPITYHLAGSLGGAEKFLKQSPDSNRIFLREGKLIDEGERLVQPELAETFARLKEKGPREFYEGRTAQLIAADMKVNGGLITERDLKAYDPPVHKPLIGSYRGYEIVTMPPPSSGGTALLEMLNILEGYNLTYSGPGSSDTVHLLVEAQRRAFADRAEFMGDADFVKVPVEGLISQHYATGLTKTI